MPTSSIILEQMLAQLQVDMRKSSVVDFLLSISPEPKAIADLLSALASAPDSYPWRVYWMLNHFTELNPVEMNAFEPELWDILKAATNDSAKRDLWRALTFLKHDFDRSGEMFDVAMSNVRSEKIPVAERVHSFTVAATLAEKHPELRNELEEVRPFLIRHERPSLRAVGRRINS